MIEHVPYDNAALGEFVRIVNSDGFVLLTVPKPAMLAKTREWGYPDEKQHGHFRVYGADIVDRLRRYLPHAGIGRMVVSDPVTDVEEWVFILTKNCHSFSVMASKLPNLHEVTAQGDGTPANCIPG